MPNTKMHNAYAITKAIAAAMVAATLVSGCGVVSGIMNDGVSNPITPEESKAQVIDAAKDIVSILDLPVETAVFWRSSCNDQGEAPFRGRMRIAYPLAPSLEESDAEVAQMIQQLQTKGWTTDSDVHTHGTALTKNGVGANFWPQSVSDTTRSLELLGECRDVTTTKQTAGNNEHIDLD
jgi:hypothetical protein